ncbi:MAG: LysR substrate-binding domain-containing protein [Alphaproteobacteria bacterium]
MRDLPLNALRAFAAVYEAGGVRPAARALQITHSSVSRHLRALEAWIGLPLCEKDGSTRALAFTPQGEALARAGVKCLNELAGALAALREAKRGNGVTISTTPSFAARWLLPRLPRFEKSYPWIELSVIAEQRLSDPTAQGADLAIRMGQGPWPGLACEPLMDEALYPVMSRSYWEKAGRPRTPGELAGLRLLHDRDPQASWEAWRAVHRAGTLAVRRGPRFASSDLVLRAAGQGMGVALARGRLAADDIMAGTLIRPLGELHVVLPDAYWIVRSETAAKRVAVTAVIDWLKRQRGSARSPAPER